MKTDLFIAGAGPAGLTAAQYGARAGLRVTIAERLAVGGQALLIDNLENYPGAGGANDDAHKSGFELVDAMKAQAAAFGARFITDAVHTITKTSDGFTVTTADSEPWLASAVIVATGTKHKTLGVPGETEFYGKGVSYCATCDGPFFKSKRIFVVGGGDVAVSEAAYLSRLSRDIVLAHRRDKLRAQKILADRVLHNPNITVRFNTRIVEIIGEQKVNGVILEDAASGARNREEADAAFIFIGSTPQIPDVRGAEFKTDSEGYVLTGQDMQTSIPGLFAAGDCRKTPFRQVVVACGEGAIAAHCAAAYIDGMI
ncbi:MAG: FAD-dependent oxidoreductase [Treponema sp.]|jgi:thioredoxin reductase (NADPH)|nr:FAD-dependent oxidoreductase [Treponema sp.]